MRRLDRLGVGQADKRNDHSTPAHFVPLAVLADRVLLHGDAQVVEAVPTNRAVGNLDTRAALQLVPMRRAYGLKQRIRTGYSSLGLSMDIYCALAPAIPVRVRSDTWIAMSEAPYAKSIGLIMTSGTPFSPASAVARFSLWRSNSIGRGAKAPRRERVDELR